MFKHKNEEYHRQEYATIDMKNILELFNQQIISSLLVFPLESVKIPAFEASQGKLSTINLELGSKDECPITQPMNYQKKEMDFSLGK